LITLSHHILLAALILTIANFSSLSKPSDLQPADSDTGDAAAIFHDIALYEGVSPQGELRQPRNCPCPNEIGKAGCDNGICNIGFVQNIAVKSRIIQHRREAIQNLSSPGQEPLPYVGPPKRKV
jgi:hypothetical protein